MKRTAARKRFGKPPGHLVYTGVESDWPTQLEFWNYDAQKFTKKQLNSWKLPATEGVNWINVIGVHNTDVIAHITSEIGLDPLLAEDITNLQQRPKIVEADGVLFATAKMIYKKDEITFQESLSIVLFDNTVICFQERPGDVFNSIRKRLENSSGKIRKQKADYLFFCVMDLLVDHYMLVNESLSNNMDALEEAIFDAPKEDHLESIHQSRKEIIQLKKGVAPLRDAMLKLLRIEEDSLLQTNTRKYIHDSLEQLVGLSESTDALRELNTDLKDLYLSSISFRMNKIMQTLTVISVIFIPLTFIAGVYGMNLKNIPEMEWDYGYAFFWGITLLIGLILLIFFKRRNWF